MTNVTQILAQIEKGDPVAADELLPLVYAELRALASARLKRELPGQTIQPTALVHEAYMRLVDVAIPQNWDSRGHFFAAAAEAMRRILVDAARRKASEKRGGRLMRKEYDESIAVEDGDSIDLLELDEALSRLREADVAAAKLVELRYFAGLTMEQVAGILGVSPRNAYYTWTYARTWLRREMMDSK